jgi:2-keto-4-pentenoate hydratase/2-oxohepta-3-ene-1,7-dioic acid hydratase in catechol pathway
MRLALTIAAFSKLPVAFSGIESTTVAGSTQGRSAREGALAKRLGSRFGSFRFLQGRGGGLGAAMTGAKGAGYKIATYQSTGGPRAALVVADRVFDAAVLTGKPAYATVIGILADWKSAEAALKKAAARAGKSGTKSRRKSQPLAKTKLLAPVQFPSVIYCAGSNYADHATEMAARDGRPPPPDPHSQDLKAWHFLKAPRAIANPGAAVKISGYAQQMDWEIELAAVIGRKAKDVPRDKALAHVAGYTIANDLSARDRGRRANVPDSSPFKWDWTKHKTFDGSCPLGPWIVPASDIGDPQRLGLKLWVNGVLKQDSNTAEMIFTLAEQIEQLSAGMTLYPGDIILTGTPAGVGAGRGEFLKAGDIVKLWIEKIGEIENRMA